MSDRAESRYRSQRSTCDLERDRVHPPPRFEGSQSPLVITWCSGVVSMVLVYPALPTEREELVDEHEKMKVAHYRDLSGGNEVNVMSPYKWCRFYTNDIHDFLN